jgi:hypothetical protein
MHLSTIEFIKLGFSFFDDGNVMAGVVVLHARRVRHNVAWSKLSMLPQCNNWRERADVIAAMIQIKEREGN